MSEYHEVCVNCGENWLKYKECPNCGCDEHESETWSESNDRRTGGLDYDV